MRKMRAKGNTGAPASGGSGAMQTNVQEQLAWLESVRLVGGN